MVLDAAGRPVAYQTPQQPDGRHGSEARGHCGVSLKEPSPSSLRRVAALATKDRRAGASGVVGASRPATACAEGPQRQSTAMPLTTGSHPLPAPFPNFMSVFGEEATRTSSRHASLKSDGDATPHASTQPLARTLSNPEAVAANLAASSGPDPRRGSSITHRSDSTDSSPTTTISTLDSTLTDPSPSSSPESPASHHTNLSAPQQQNMKSLNARAHDASAESPLDGSRDSSLNSSPVRPATSGGEISSRRLRNAKNLSINTTGINTKQTTKVTLGASSLTHVAESSTSSLPAVTEPRVAPTALPGHVLPSAPGDPATGHAFSAPASPSAILPSIPPPRKSKLGLTLKTAEPEAFDWSGAIPPTPSRPTAIPLRSRASDLGSRLKTVPETPGPTPLSSMRETQDSGEILFSPAVAPGGGMQLPPFARNVDPTLPTPGFGPSGGMQLPRFQPPAGLLDTTVSPSTRTARPALIMPKPAFDAPGSSTVVQHTVSHRPPTPQHELPLSREAKSPGYPDGPVCIYPPSVYLYHQPTKDEARQFDVIINVAREVANPFLAKEGEAEEASTPVTPSRYKDAGVQCTLIGGELNASKNADAVPEPSSAVSDKTFVSAFERPVDEEPDTPKASAPSAPFGSAAPAGSAKDPEYIHLPWEHNSKVYEDWLRVCKLIDDRVRKGQRVLIHCQLGVSRSASLVVAYGIFRNPRLTPDEAREQAKRRSRWIDLNMHFMYELGDFRKLLGRTFPEAAAQQQLPGPRPPTTARWHVPGAVALTRTKTDSFLVGGTADDRSSPREDVTARRASTPNQVDPHFEPMFEAGEGVPATAPLRASWSPTSMNDTPDLPGSYPEEPSQKTPTEATTPLQPSRPPPPLPTDAIRTPSADAAAAPRTVERTGVKPYPIIPPDVNASPSPSSHPTPQTATRAPTVTHVPVENAAPGTARLPPPNLTLPPAQSQLASGSGSSPQPRRSLRPMPSLPAGFNSSIRSRRLLLHPISPSPPPAVPPLPLHLQTSQPTPSLTTNFSRPQLQPMQPVGPTGAPPDEDDADLDALTSPRATEFTANPFHCHAHRSSAGDLAVAGAGGRGSAARRPVETDPRSPHVLGREPIVRSIDDVLE